MSVQGRNCGISQNFKMAGLLAKICVGILTVILLSGSGSRADERRDDKEISIKKMEQQLEILTNEVKELKTDVAGLKGVTKDADKDFELLEASRHVLLDGRVRMQVSYRKKNDVEVSHRWTKRIDFKHDLITDFGVQEHDSSDGHCRVDSWVFIEQNNDTHVICEMDIKNDIFLSVFMKNDMTAENVTDTELEIPILQVTPPKEIVYQPNENATIEITVPQEQKRMSPGHPGMDENYRADLLLLEPGASKVVSHMSSDDFFHQIKLEKFLDRQTMNAELNTAELSYSGLVHFYGLIHYEDKLVYTIQKGLELVLRPASQEGPFPVGKVYPMERSWIEKDDDDTDRKFCSVGEICSIMCIFVGDHISSFKLEKSVHGVTVEIPMEIFANVSSDHKYVTGSYQWDVPSDVSSEVLTCVASDEDSGETVRDPVRIHYGHKVQILRNETRKEIFSNRTALVRCAASGQPRPTVTINCDEKSPQVVLYQTDDVTAVSKLCGEWGWTDCTATNEMTTDQIWDFDDLTTTN